MKTSRLFLRSLLAVFLPAVVSFVSKADDVFQWGELFFKIENGVATVMPPNGTEPTGTAGAYALSTIVVPKEITKDGATYQVTKVGRGAFEYSSATAIYLPSTVTEIENWGLARNNIQKIVLPDGITTMKESAVSNNSSLTEVWLPQSLTVLNSSLFQYSNLQFIALPKNIITLDNESFKGNDLSQGAFLNQGLSEINPQVFSESKLTYIALPTSLTYFGSGGTAGAFDTQTFTSILIDCTLDENRSNAPYGNGYINNVFITNKCTTKIKLYVQKGCILNYPNDANNYNYNIYQVTSYSSSKDDSSKGDEWDERYEMPFDIVLGTIPTFYYGDGSINLNSYLGSTTNGAGITYTTSTPDVITINGTTATFNRAGIAEVTATATDGRTIANPSRRFYVMPNTVVVGIADDGSFTYSSQTFRGDIAGKVTTKPTVVTYNQGTEAEFSVGQGAASDCFVFVYDSKLGNAGSGTTPAEPAKVELADFPMNYTYGTTQTIALATLDAEALNGVEGAELTYESSNPNVATVDDSGVLTVKGAGTTEITATPGDETKFTIESGAKRTLTIGKAESSLGVKIADGTTFTYGEAWTTEAFSPVISPLYNGDETTKVLPDGFQPQYKVQFGDVAADLNGAVKNAGNHAVTLSEIPETSNYTLKAGEPAQLQVAKKKLIVKVKSKEIASDAKEIPEPEFELQGIVEGDDEAAIKEGLEVKWNITGTPQAGSYEASVGGTHANYEFVAAEDNGKLTVTAPGYKLLFELTYKAADAQTTTVSVTATEACNIKINGGEPFKIEAGTQLLTLSGVTGNEGLMVMTVETDHPEYFTAINVSKTGATELEIGPGATNLTDIDISDNAFGMEVQLPDTLDEADMNITANQSRNLEVEVGADNKSVTLPEGYRPEDGCDVKWRDGDGNLLAAPDDYTYDADSGTYTFNKNMNNVQGEITKGKASVKTSQFDITGATTDKYFAITAPADLTEGTVEFKTEPADALKLNAETSQWEVKEGATVIFTVEPKADYYVANTKLNGEEIEIPLQGGDYTVEKIDKALTLEVNFVKSITYSVYVTNQTPEGGDIAMTVTPARYKVSGNDAMSTVLQGAKVEFTVTPAPGYKLDKATLTGVDVTADMNGDVYVIASLDKLAVFEASFTKTTAMGSVSALGNSISLQGRTLTFPGIERTAGITVTDVAGRTIASGNSTMQVELPAKGVYIIVIDEQSWKIAVK